MKLDDGQLYLPDGSNLRLGGERVCEKGRVQAFQFFNLSHVDLENNGNLVRAVSAGVFLKDTARNVEMKNQWHEYTLFSEANNFIWTPKDTGVLNIYQVPFNKGSCSYDRTFENQAVPTEIREGIILRSPDMRSDPDQKPALWKKCNFGFPGKPGFEECRYQILEFFVPIENPKQQCPQKTIADTWLGIGTKRAVLTDMASYARLNELSKDRWDKKRIAEVEEDTYRVLSQGLPKVCGRWVSLDGKTQKPWWEFATIAAVWCDLE